MPSLASKNTEKLMIKQFRRHFNLACACIRVLNGQDHRATNFALTEIALSIPQTIQILIHLGFTSDDPQSKSF